MKNIKEKKCKNCMTEEKLIKTKLEIEAKEYEQKQGYKGLLDALYEEGQNKGYECARSYITPYIVRAYLAGAEPREKRIAELEQENAELKEDMANAIPLLEKAKDINDQLTKAKDFLKRCYENYIYLEPLRSEIEQFLNSEVEK